MKFLFQAGSSFKLVINAVTQKTIYIISTIEACTWNFKNAICFISLLAYRVLLDVLYVTVIGPTFHYTDIFFVEVSNVKLVISYIIMVFAISCFSHHVQKTNSSNLMMICIEILYFIPLQTLFACGGISYLFYWYAMLYWLLLEALIIFLPHLYFEKKSTPSQRLFYIFTSCCILFVIFIMFYTDSNLISNFEQIYSVRSSFANAGLPRICYYFFSMLAPVIPLLMVYSISKKKYLLAFTLLAIALLHFMLNASKTMLYYTIISLVMYIIYEEKRKVWLPLGMTALLLLGGMEFFLRESVFILSSFCRRMMLVPVILSTQYFDYFSSHPIDFLRTGVLGKLGISSPYNGRIPYMMGYQYQGITTAANNGMIGDAFLCFGYWGVLLSPIILAFCFRFLDACTNGIDRKIKSSVAVLFTLSFINSNWSTILLTHGFLLCCVVFYFLFESFKTKGETL